VTFYRAKMGRLRSAGGQDGGGRVRGEQPDSPQGETRSGPITAQGEALQNGLASFCKKKGTREEGEEQLSTTERRAERLTWGTGVQNIGLVLAPSEDTRKEGQHQRTKHAWGEWGGAGLRKVPSG